MKKYYMVKEMSMETNNGESLLNLIFSLYDNLFHKMDDEEDRKKLTLDVMNKIRKLSGETRMMAFVTKITGEVVLLVFDKEPDGKTYRCNRDEDGVFITIDEDGE